MGSPTKLLYPATIHIPVGVFKKTNRGSENDSISEKSLKFNLICFDIPAINCFICLVCNLSYRDRGIGYQNSTGQEDYYGYKKIRDSSNGPSLKEMKR